MGGSETSLAALSDYLLSIKKVFRGFIFADFLLKPATLSCSLGFFGCFVFLVLGFVFFFSFWVYLFFAVL